jgi:hypothetical protein
MNILLCGSCYSDWIWPFQRGFIKLGHDVKRIGFGGSNDPRMAIKGATNDWLCAKARYSEHEYNQFRGDFKYRFDIPLPDKGLVIDGEPSHYTWSLVETELKRWVDDWAPDLILIFESTFCFLGDPSDRFKNIPIGYLVCDNRGADGHYRQIKQSRASFCFLNNAYYWDIYKHWGLNPIGIAPMCVDTDVFYPLPERTVTCDVLFSGSTGLDIDLNQQPNWRMANFSNPFWGEGMYRGELIRELATTREIDFRCANAYFNPYDWMRAMNGALINFNPSGAIYPHKHALNGRLYAASACGRLLFTQWDVDLARSYDDGKELIAFKEYSHPRHHEIHWFDLKVLKDKICYYVEHEDEREEIAANGLKATRERHECKVRAQQVLDAITEAGYL